MDVTATPCGSQRATRASVVGKRSGSERLWKSPSTATTPNPRGRWKGPGSVISLTSSAASRADGRVSNPPRYLFISKENSLYLSITLRINRLSSSSIVSCTGVDIYASLTLPSSRVLIMMSSTNVPPGSRICKALTNSISDSYSLLYLLTTLDSAIWVDTRSIVLSNSSYICQQDIISLNCLQM